MRGRRSLAQRGRAALRAIPPRVVGPAVAGLAVAGLLTAAPPDLPLRATASSTTPSSTTPSSTTPSSGTPSSGTPSSTGASSTARRMAAAGLAAGSPDIGAARQVIVVRAASWRSTRGTLTAYQWGAGGWQVAIPATPAWLGAGGLTPAASRRQGSGTTPTGSFALPRAFGRLSDPGTALPYRRFDRDDAWPYDPRDPATYNVFQHRDAPGRWRSGFVERLWRLRDQYRYAVVLDYNLPPLPYRVGADGVRRALVPADTRRGGGIFLHVDDGRPTSGCVGIALDRMRALLRWLDPAQDPRIVIGTA